MSRTPTGDAEVFDNAEEHRYEIESDGQLVGVAEYASTTERVILTHTEVGAPFAGTGLGSRLTKAALDDVRRQNKGVTPMCSFVAAYIDRHPEYTDLVAQ
jgi:predicted GNAT family acetyltransferase